MASRRSDRSRAVAPLLLAALICCALVAPVARAQENWDQVLRALTLEDRNTRVVILGTTLLGLSAGVIGSFMLLRKRALMGDALSHATLPGIGLAFIIATTAGVNARSLPILLVGAAVTGVIGVLAVLAIRGASRIKEDAALGIVLSVFFGAGVVVLGFVQKMQTGSAAGLESFIYGKAASMLVSDAQLIAGTAVIVVVLCTLLFKEFALLCFDSGYARSEGWPVLGLDLLMMGLVVLVTVIGLQAVGLILILALLIIPAAAARFWTDRLVVMVTFAALIGAISGFVGTIWSALAPRMPAGAIIVIVATGLFLVSMAFGIRRGVLVRWLEQRRLNRNVARQHLMRAIYEWSDETGHDPRQVGVPREALLSERSWSSHQLNRQLGRAERDGLLYETADGTYRVTEDGWADAIRTARNHRLWEAYLIAHADVAPSHVDRNADTIEHILGPQMIRKLELLIADEHPGLVPPSPHMLRKT